MKYILMYSSVGNLFCDKFNKKSFPVELWMVLLHYLKIQGRGVHINTHPVFSGVMVFAKLYQSHAPSECWVVLQAAKDPLYLTG